ncbi:MAG: hypothetical protein AB1938_03835 [Myxococcota bacterium]
MSEEDVDIAREELVDEFERGTRIQHMTDGSLRLKLPAMPASWPHRRGVFDSFQAQLAAAAGVAVEGLDKELFGIPRPGPETAAAVRAFLLAFRRQHET